MSIATVYVPHTGGRLVGPAGAVPWIADDLLVAATPVRPPGQPGQPVFRTAAQAWAWVDWARRDGGLARIPLAVAKVDATLVRTLHSTSPELHIHSGALSDPAAQVRRHQPPPADPTAALAAAAARATAEASRQWERMAASPRRGGRIVTAATVAWQAAYPIAYTHGYTTFAHWLAEHIHDIHSHVSTPGSARRDVAAAVRRLIDVAQAATPGQVAVPQPPPRVLETAALAALDRLDGRTAPQAITHDVHAYAIRVAGMNGALTAATDIRNEWRGQTDRSTLAAPLDGGTLAGWVDATFATVNREFITPWVSAPVDVAAKAPALARASFAAPATADTPPAATPPQAQPGTVIALRRRSSR